MMASGMPFTKQTTSGMTCFLAPFTLNWRVTTKSLFAGLSKSKKRTCWLLRPVAEVLLQRDAVGEGGVERSRWPRSGSWPARW